MNFPSAAATALPGRCGKRQGHRPRQLVQARRSRGRKQSQEAAQSPGGGSRGPPPGRCAGPLGGAREALRPAAAPGWSAPPRVPWVPKLCPCPPGAGGGRTHSPWGEGGGLPAPGTLPASVAPGHQLQAACLRLRSHFLPAQPASRKPRPGHPQAPPPSAGRTLPWGFSVQVWAVQVAGEQAGPRDLLNE